MIKCLECQRGYKSEEVGWVLCPTCFIKLFEINYKERGNNGVNQCGLEPSASGSRYAARGNDGSGLGDVYLRQDKGK